MADFSIKIKAEELGKTLDGIGEQLERELEGAVADLAHGAYAKIAADAQAGINSSDSRQQYLKGLEIVELGPSSYLVTLQGEEANRLEEGYDGFSIKDALLRSKKIVQLGKRSGEPWVRTNKETGSKYAHVPIQLRPSSKEAGKRSWKRYSRNGWEGQRGS